MDITAFISVVFLKKPLWDQKNPLHHNRFVLDKEWDDVAIQMNTTRKVVRSKWKSLRDTYRKELHKMPIPHSGDDGSQTGWKSSWKYFETLSFLKDQFVVRSAGGNLPGNETPRSPPEVIEESEESMPHSDIQNLGTQAEKQNSAVTAAQTKRKRPSDESNAPIIRFVKREMELLVKTLAPKHPEPVDDDISFFNSLLPFVRSLSPPTKLLWRMQVEELLHSFVTNTQGQIFAPQSGPVEQTFHLQYGSFSRPTTPQSYDQNELSNPSSVASYYSNFSDEQH